MQALTVMSATAISRFLPPSPLPCSLSPPLSSPAGYAHSDNSGATPAGSSMTLLMLYQCHYLFVSKLSGCQVLYGNQIGCVKGFC